MNISLFSLLILAVGLYYVISRSIKFFKRENANSLVKYLTVLIVWVFISIFALFPSVPHFFSTKLGLGQNLNTFIFAGFITVFIFLFRLLSIIEKLERDITVIIRKEALKELLK